MRNFFLFTALLAFAIVSCNPAATDTAETTQITDNKMLRHVVLFKFKDTSSEADVNAIVEAFKNLPNEIPEIKDFEWGTNNSPEGLDDGFTHLFFVSFESEEDRAIYLPHPKHKEFVDLLSPHLEKALVVDYWAEK